jgi:hypothetical protein
VTSTIHPATRAQIAWGATTLITIGILAWLPWLVWSLTGHATRTRWAVTALTLTGATGTATAVIRMATGDVPSSGPLHLTVGAYWMAAIVATMVGCEIVQEEKTP